MWSPVQRHYRFWGRCLNYLTTSSRKSEKKERLDYACGEGSASLSSWSTTSPSTDESPVPHVLSRRLTSYLQWSACLEDRTGGGSYPSRAEYLDPQGIIDVLFFSPQTVVEERAVAEEAEVEDESEEETSEEEESYSEYNEEDPGEEEDEDQLEEEEESEWETLGEEADCAEAQEEDPEAAARQREEIMAGKQPLEYKSGADLPILNDPTRDLKPPKNDDGDSTAETSSPPARK
ncbi:hypothetical protein CBR_g12283 [Chara braunii]|uniref:Uncharacterized protein n=1 Tax=Chara braunii TaxID=69332 RepID=A0A388KRM3_CHABU|nr:hypothetical protein CBR_g12283 [Chara braunii]|eukprot:GBG72715.1 hypothetical protein CBR_g12283 [Chara braunii]